MELGKEILYLSRDDVVACGLTLAEVEAAVEAMFAAKAAGKTVMKPKIGLAVPPYSLFLAQAGALESPAYAGLKWAGIQSTLKAGTLPHISGLIVINDFTTGMPVMVMDGTWVTGVRTAAITAVAAKHLARSDSSGIGFVACGVQARSHLVALREHFPLAHVRAYSRRRATAETYADEIRAQGLEAEAVAEPRAAVEGMDIVISTVPILPRIDPFLDAAWLAPGSFAGIVDLGWFWIPESLAILDRVVTDDLDQAVTEGLPQTNTYDGDVAALVAGTLPGRQTRDERMALIFAGLGLADVAVGAAIYERAQKRGIGSVLPL